MKKYVFILICLIAVSSVFVQEKDEEISIIWYGHSCFKITYAGKSIVTDPFNPEYFNYKLPKEDIDYAFSTHSHSDHNYFKGINAEREYKAKGDEERFDLNYQGEKTKVEGKITEDIDGKKLTFWTVPSYHDREKGSKRGSNGILCFDLDGLNIVHLGDLGHLLDKKHLEKIGNVDILIIPVGGYYTIGPEEAIKTIEMLNPKIVIPMHYKTEALPKDHPIAFIADFLDLCRDMNVKKFDKCSVSVKKNNLPEETYIYILQYYKE